MKRALKIIGIVVAILVVVLIALPFIIDVNMFRPQIEAELTSAMGREVKVGNLKLSILGGSVGADDLSIADDPAFSRQPFVRAKALNVGVELMPLILSKTLNVTELTIDQPQVTLLRNASGKWNFSSLGSQAASPAGGGRSSSGADASQKKPGSRPATSGAAQTANPELSVGKLSVKNGSVSIQDLESRAKPRVYQNVNITVENFSFQSQFPFTLTANLPGGGSVKLDGKAGPIDPTDASLTPLQAKINVKGLDLAASGFVDPSSGIAGVADFDGTVTSDGRQVRTNGVVTANKLKLSPKGSPAGRAVVVKYATVYELRTQTGQLTEGDVTMGKALARLTGGYQVQPATTILNMKLNADNMPVEDLEAMLPALGVVLPSGSSLQGGTLSANLGITGPVEKLVITGPIKLANSKLANFSLGSKLAAISKFTGGGQSGSDTLIQNLSTDVHVAPDGINTQNVNLTVPSLGVVTGSGTISPQNALNYTMNASLSGGVMGGLTQLAGLGNKGANLPFFIQGTTSDPKFVPNVKGMLGNQFGQFKPGTQGQNPANSVIQGLGGLFGQKKPK